MKSIGFAIAFLFAAFLRAHAEPVSFLRDVRPILSGHCFKCHGQDAGARKGDLRLDLREEALKTALVPKKPDQSEMIRRIYTEDEDDLMPPPSAKHPLTSKQKEILKQWVSDGAEYQPHWAFIAPRTPPIPTISSTSWPRNAIDHFVLARLESEKLKPSPPADKYTLARRLYLDLIGLPPTPAQADALVDDPSPAAYERLVDDLLASPRYGERWARRWLDLARYADTNGYEKDRQRSIWPYRDWVIRALNDDMPFDQFTVEQLAGDMLPNATTDQIVATGFHRNTMLNEEGGIDPLEYRFYSVVDRVHVTATAWLGLTMACAQCHTHKYDPIQHNEYYQFMAYLDNADEPGLELPRADIAAQRRVLEEKIAKLEASLGDQFPPDQTIEWTTPARQDFASEGGADGEFLIDGSWRITGKNPDKDNYAVRFEITPRSITHLQIEAIPDETVEKGGPGRATDGAFVLSDMTCEIETAGEMRKLAFDESVADFGRGITNRAHRRLILTLKDRADLAEKSTVTVRLVQQDGSRKTLGRFRVTLGNDLSPTATLAARRKEHLERKFAQWFEAETAKVVEWTQLRPTKATSAVPYLTVQADNSVFALGDFTKSDTYHLEFRGVPAGARAIRIEALPDPRLPSGGPGTVRLEGPDGDFWLSTLKVRSGGKERAIQAATESYADEKNNAARAIDDDLQSGWSVKGAVGRAHNAVFEFTEPLDSSDFDLDLTFERYYAAGLGRFRVSITTQSGAKASILGDEAYDLAVQWKEAASIAPPDNREPLLRDFHRVSPELKKARAEIDNVRGQMPKYAATLVMRERPSGFARATFVHHRGEFLQAKDQVKPAIPSFLKTSAGEAPRDRLEFARWLVSRENPLTARVTMNRQWEAFFGRGLVRTLEDFGFQGELPSHPDLLDWLAVEFMEQGWSVKKMHKLIVMSAAYQQSSAMTPDLAERDSQNVLLARGPRFRLDAEAVRDSALVASGLLSDKLGGASVFPPQPSGVTTEGTYGPLQWKTSEGADRYRRALYTFAKRTAPFAMNLTFDGSSGEACVARRDRSNTPLQALTLLNDEVFLECSRAIGNWAANRGGSVEEIADELFRRFVARPPSKSEHERFAAFHKAQIQRLEAGELKASEIVGQETGDHLNAKAAWTLVARVVLNLDESVTKP